MASIELQGVEKIYPNGHRAIHDFSLRAEAGELLVLVGPSGCGKSTVLRLLAGLEEITAGTLLIGGRRANHLSPRERNIAMVFQDYALYPTMTVRGNLEFPLRMRQLGPEEIRRRVAWAAELLDLAAVLERLPRQLSGGQRQRVAMGRALVREPSVFLLDEPLSNLDAKLRTQVRGEIADLQRRTGTTMVYVTHDQVEAMTLGRRIAVLNGGRIEQVADPETLYARPLTPFVASFVGSPPMNVFEADVDPAGEAETLLRVNGETVGRLATARLPPGCRRVTAGIRPECLHESGPQEPGFAAVVANAEFLGHETLLHVRPGMASTSLLWTARLPGMHRYPPDSVLRLGVRPDGIYLFPPKPVP
jgi:multiple sugar transport system ATP-binding protein